MKPRRAHAPPVSEGDRRADRHIDRDRETVYGFRAALAVFATRPNDILRVAVAHERARDAEVRPLLEWARNAKIPNGEVPAVELDRVSQSEHHEGIAILMKPRAWLAPQALAALLVEKKGTAIALDRVRNPYNVGAVIRSAAFFGTTAAIIGASAPHPALPPQAIRVAEGGAEHVALARTTDLGTTLAQLRTRGVRVLGADGTATKDAAKMSFAGPVVVVMGNEREGLAPRVRAECDELVALRGTGAVESLNVAVAASLFLERLARSA